MYEKWVLKFPQNFYWIQNGGIQDLEQIFSKNLRLLMFFNTNFPRFTKHP